MSMYEVGTVTGAANQAKVTGATTKWSQTALGIQQGSILVVYRSGNADLYAIKSVDSDTQLTLTRDITTAFSGASYGIITSETASTSAFANQLASAFSLWRSVVEGWSAALTSTGNITMTDPITGTSVTVPAIKGMAKIAGGNNLTGTQSLDSDDSGFILGKNSDIGLIKKSGTYGKVMVGKSSRFSVVRSDQDRISATDGQTEIFGVEANGDVKVVNSLYAKGILQSDYQVKAQSIELSFSSPYIDFHYGNSAADYTHRIIADDPVALGFECSIRVSKNIRAQEGIKADKYVRAASRAGLIAQYDSDPGGNIGDIRVAPILCSQFATVGADGNGNAGGNFWFEEHIGNNHRLVTQVKGYGASVQYWHHRSDGMIWNSQRGDVAWAATSDKNLKHDIKPTDGLQSLKNINAMKLVTFIYNDDERERQRRGVIAQQLQKIDPCYVKVSKGVVNRPAIKDDEGNEIEPEHQEVIEKLVLDSNPLLMDALSAIQVLSREISELRAENRDLRAFVHFE
ncbi:tail fiber domain-containing protein [Klebsiella pneumoniae]|uniref:tail fiber domain-containing protein n=1 Tax=Klebsiella pneumoniae TaxID=573 RepID=UPI000CEC4E81|nr:tail fiber domain-containing protein [Klebsiella pneumoniae]AVO98626.1 endosialidase chaperone [Klebsiella pneumoniae subsp. ozaenae]HBR2032427.1 tail fiber domain-containing protein [Klebsiella quasipneumoniae subsp. quasipneumoniae]AXZ16914.1 tail fiber domain-containing protein [Klebsiella pneumoniae]MBX4747712.1 endosialidase chaperone [Klebsiella pneumoniae]MCJ4930035.1 tail fiber domain-containing protein [Klebsiella pneumoniae]